MRSREPDDVRLLRLALLAALVAGAVAAASRRMLSMRIQPLRPLLYNPHPAALPGQHAHCLIGRHRSRIGGIDEGLLLEIAGADGNGALGSAQPCRGEQGDCGRQEQGGPIAWASHTTFRPGFKQTNRGIAPLDLVRAAIDPVIHIADSISGDLGDENAPDPLGHCLRCGWPDSLCHRSRYSPAGLPNR